MKKLLKKCTVLLLTAAMSITALPVTAWAETPAESAVMGAETATDHVDENAVDEKQAAGTEQRLNYMYIDQPYLETPNTQKVVVSWGDGSEGIEQMTATVQGPVGEEVWTAVQESDGIYLFERAYTEQERGVYSVTELHVTIAGNVYDYSLADLGIEALFGVDEKYEGIEELQPVSEEEVSADIAAYNIDESGNVTEQSSIEEAIVQAEQEIPAMMSDDGVQTQSSNIVVALDPGHDSTHVGASANGVREEVLTLKIAQYCKAELEEYAGVSVYMTRTTADCPHPGGSSAHDIDQRVADAAAAGASVYVSFHLNSSLSSAAKGAEIIIPNTNWKPQVGNDGKKLATLIESELVGLGLEERKIYSKNTTVNERYEDGSLSDYFTVQISAKEHGIPGIIVEHAFVTNTSDVNNFLNNEAGLKKLGVADATGIAKYFGLSKGQWYKDYTGWWYASGTSYLKNQWAQISGSWYYFDFNGYMETGWQKISGKWSYLGGTDDGIMRIGWQKIGTNWYYFNSSGYMLTGWQKIGTKWYYFGESDDGAMRIGWQKIGGDRYYFGEANDGAMKTGWQKIGESWYYLGSSNGGYLQTGWQKIGGAWYYFSDKENGAMKTGWQKVGSTWYYLGSADGGYMQTGWRKLGTNWYYFGGTDDGAMRTGFAKVGGDWYYFGGTDDGAMKNGWQKVGSTWYYLGSADDGYMQTGWKKLGTNWYYFGESNDGAMRTGFTKVGGDWYYFGGADDGAMKTGWQKIDGTWYFFNDDGMYDSTKKYDEIPGINDDKINGSAGTNNSNTNSNVVEGTYLIEGDTEVTVDQMVAYFEASKKAYPEDVMRKGGAATIRDFCQIYYEEAVAEGIKAEVAFVQAMKETGWLQFTGVVKAEQYNFAGMGATGNSVSGESFKDVREGVRAQIQHLKAYGSTKSLNQTCVDNRFKYVERGSAIYVEWLSIPNNPKKKGWAAAKGYGVDIVKMIQKLKKM
ncbi:N-acetylmuramoyl-L-alanine amidase [Mediterraneibacter faecis]|uniref:N-acetylmuramoyl-L-alanine amidase n=1 Tax=Mediterraneibacter faecis TaxID=592978 RepID=UPI001D007260|nr:N-acetylmuramoyl-L-alanine amidase [Mediterraneibacter faecis]MCB5571267.1 N-acetylmuramoyl-L-alanine amidase [Mediterraneibacter faecis]MCB5572998.1 N-acetylmuramoyl-L-alanine amidase [Mediterraneibacter faecis]MCB5739732.1 N-acetylmuramoyl-L-alanine amidase [Mediterraneibacter faecis]MCB5750818.1 N-acetylmuramoyl-L-alanine amidase [Mediterraneibacter faecis]